MIKQPDAFTGALAVMVAAVCCGGLIARSERLLAQAPGKEKRVRPPDPWIGKKVVTKKEENDKAIADYTEAIALEPNDFDDFSAYVGAYTSRASAWAKKKEYDKAIADNTEATSIRPKSPLAYNNRAWIWATCPDQKNREGKKAVESATTACELTEWHDPEFMDTLAAAYAEASDFAAAVKWQTKANELRGGPVDRAPGEARLKLYQEKKPYRDGTP